MNFLLLILFIVIIILLIVDLKKHININSINKDIEEKNKQIQIENEKLTKEKESKEEELKKISQELAEIGEKSRQTLEDIETISKDAANQYFQRLEDLYKEKEQDYEDSLGLLEFNYIGKQDEMLWELDETKRKLKKLKDTHAAAIQARLREEEIQQQQDFYSLTLEDVDKREIRALQSIEDLLRDPRPVRMIIWTAYYSKKANDLASRILGPNNVSGIYKITNKNNKLCYIGQAKNIKERWREHMKCGLGIDTPANNRLYQAMKKEGLETFTFELIEQCPIADLNEKEVFYIDLYDSKNYGYNSTGGNKKA